jgi:molybdenum cofactor cytidylyltransferase
MVPMIRVSSDGAYQDRRALEKLPQGGGAEEEPFSLGVAILAAGAASRMKAPKLLLPWGETTVLGALVRRYQELGAAQVAVVCARGDTRMHEELDRLNVPCANRIVNEAPEEGMFSSVLIAARWTGWSQGLSHWAIAIGDQPQVQADTLRTLVQFVVQHPTAVVQPSRNGRGRHPVVLPCWVFKRLAESRASHLKQFLQSDSGPIVLCEMPDPGLDFDLDYPEDYRRALQLCFRMEQTTADERR